MLDFGPVGDHKEFAKRIRAYEAKMYKRWKLQGPIPRVSHNFRFACLTAAQHLMIKKHAINNDVYFRECRETWTGRNDCPLELEQCIAYAVWGYNGRASWHRDKEGKRTHKKSSYVWSDPKNGVDLMMRYTKKDGTYKEFVDKRPGVMVIYEELIFIFGKMERQ